MHYSSRRRFLTQGLHKSHLWGRSDLRIATQKPAFEPGIRPCFAGVNTSCGKSGAETQLTKKRKREHVPRESYWQSRFSR